MSHAETLWKLDPNILEVAASSERGWWVTAGGSLRSFLDLVLCMYLPIPIVINREFVN